MKRLAVISVAVILWGVAGASSVLAAPPPNDGRSVVSPLDVSSSPATMRLTVDPNGGFTADGSAVITGTLECSPGIQFVSLGAQVVQRVGRIKITGFGSLFQFGCPSNWAILATSSNGLFRGGRVEVTAFAFGCDGVTCAQSEVEQTVRLSRKVSPPPVSPPVSPPISPPISPPVTDPVSPPVSDPVSPPVSQLAAALMSVMWLDPTILILGVFGGVITLGTAVGGIAARRTQRQLRLMEGRQSG